MGRLALGLTPQHGVTRWWPDGAAFAFDFTAGEAMAAGARLSAAGLLTAARAVPALAPRKPGGFAAFASDEPRITNHGLLIEDERTNLLHHSFAPTQQSVPLDAGPHALSMLGTGQIALSGEAAGSATANAPLLFTLAEPGTVTVMPTGDVTFFQLEAGAFPTSPIATEAEPATRGAESVRLADPTLFEPGLCTVLIEWEQVAPGAMADLGVQTLIRWEPADDAWSRIRSGTLVFAQVQQAGGGLVFNDGASTIAQPGIHRLALALAPNDMAIAWSPSVDGTGGLSVDNTGTPGNDPVSVHFGGTPVGERLNGWIRKLIYWPERLDDTKLLATVLE